MRTQNSKAPVALQRIVRPVRCHLCADPMFYARDPQHTPEVRVTVEADGHDEHFYVHASCWNKRLAGPNAKVSSGDVPNDRTQARRPLSSDKQKGDPGVA